MVNVLEQRTNSTYDRSLMDGNVHNIESAIENSYVSTIAGWANDLMIIQ